VVDGAGVDFAYNKILDSPQGMVMLGRDDIRNDGAGAAVSGIRTP
jgi:hypothetical protein